MRDYAFPEVCILLIPNKANNFIIYMQEWNILEVQLHGKHNTESMYQEFDPRSTGLQNKSSYISITLLPMSASYHTQCVLVLNWEFLICRLWTGKSSYCISSRNCFLVFFSYSGTIYKLGKLLQRQIYCFHGFSLLGETGIRRIQFRNMLFFTAVIVLERFP